MGLLIAIQLSLLKGRFFLANLKVWTLTITIGQKSTENRVFVNLGLKKLIHATHKFLPKGYYKTESLLNSIVETKIKHSINLKKKGFT